MSLIKNIGVGMSADTTAFTRDVFASARAMDRAAESAERMQAMMSRGGGRAAGVGASSGGQGGGLGAASLGSGVALITSAIAPLTRLGTQIASSLNAVGGTITTLARRIDAAMRLPQTKQSLNEIQAALRSRITAASGTATESLTRLQRATLALGPAADRAISGFRLFNNLQTVFNQITNRGDVARKSLTQLAKIDMGSTTASAGRLANEFRTIAPTVQRASVAVKGLGIQIGLALGFVGVIYKGTQALVGFVSTGITGAMNLGETMSKTKEVFGASTAAVVKQADDMAKAFGLPKGAMLDAAGSIGLIAEGAGKSQAEAAGLANTMAKLAADASSFYNVPLEQSLEKIRSGLVGEAEPLRAFGVLLSETAVKAEAHRLGLAKGKKELDEATKVTARASLITKGLQTASGDLARTQDSASNQFRKSGGGLQNFATQIGAILLPAVQSGIGVFNELLASVIEVFESNKGLITSWAEKLKAGIDFAGSVIRNLGDYWEIAKILTIQHLSNLLAYVETIPANFALIGGYLRDNWAAVLMDIYKSTRAMSDNIDKNIVGLFSAIKDFAMGKGWNFEWTGLLEGFTATAAALPELLKPELIDMSDQVDAIGARIAGKEARRAAELAKMGEAAKPKLPGEKAKEAGDKYKGTAAVELGSKEANSAIAKFRNQSADEKPAKETAVATKTVAAEAKTQTQLYREMLKKMDALTFSGNTYPV